MVVILLNMLMAILMDAYAEVKKKESRSSKKLKSDLGPLCYVCCHASVSRLER